MPGRMTVVIAPGARPELDLRGSLDRRSLAAALAAWAHGAAGAGPGEPDLLRHSPTRHTLRLTPHSPRAGALADLLTGSPGRAARSGGHPPAAGSRSGPGTAPTAEEAALPASDVPGPPAAPAPAPPASAHQREVLLDALTAPPGTDPHVGQLHWLWHGPLDVARFRAAWQAVARREAVLRAAFAPPATPGAGPLVRVHAEAAVEVAHRRGDTAAPDAALARERLRPFEPLRPGPLRVALVTEADGTGGAPAATRVVLTYHHALLDAVSVRLLQRAFYRAYAAGGTLPGGERRPDVRDHLDWLAGQDPAAARALWTTAAPPADALTLPAAPGGRPGPPGHGRTSRALTRYEAARLRNWAARRGISESTALHAAWALLLYRAAGNPAPSGGGDRSGAVRTVAFARATSGRGVLLEGAALLPGPLGDALPLHVAVDPAAPVARLLADLGARDLEVSGYEWVSAGQAHAWSAAPPGPPEGPAGPPGVPPAGPPAVQSVLAFASPRHAASPGLDPLYEELAEQGVRVTWPETVDAATALPLSLTARHDEGGGLVLTGVYDRSRFAERDAARAVALTTLLLRELPLVVGESTTVAQALELLGESAVPRAHRPERRAPVVLRAAARPGAGTVVLVPPPDADPACYAPLAAAYPGPRALLAVPAPADVAACLAVLRPALAAGEPLLLGCHSGGGAVAYAAAQRVAAHGWRPPPVALGGAADGTDASARALARALRDADRRAE
ncbi:MULTISPECIES: condensation domain-containing protein [Streptomyces]|uniref:condensation domain-containing protein n=1 Tax=Streptomyces TaxID=1883 RepID=UPI0022492D68|nr:condensation domain-containing protein [Streptomyces sp. JHD 1]MCX2968746.1 condensation domain-containing protein [Streptomyces sp. JHD 1]